MQTAEFYLYHNGYCDLYKFYQVVKRTAKTVTLRQVRSANGKPIANDFAENEGIDLNDILDELEELIQMKMHIDITYFTNEVLGESCVDELVEYFSESESDSIDDAMAEYGDVYNAEEIRLARIVYRSNKI